MTNEIVYTNKTNGKETKVVVDWAKVSENKLRDLATDAIRREAGAYVRKLNEDGQPQPGVLAYPLPAMQRAKKKALDSLSAEEKLALIEQWSKELNG